MVHVVSPSCFGLAPCCPSSQCKDTWDVGSSWAVQRFGRRPPTSPAPTVYCCQIWNPLTCVQENTGFTVKNNFVRKRHFMFPLLVEPRVRPCSPCFPFDGPTGQMLAALAQRFIFSKVTALQNLKYFQKRQLHHRVQWQGRGYKLNIMSEGNKAALSPASIYHIHIQLSTTEHTTTSLWREFWKGWYWAPTPHAHKTEDMFESAVHHRCFQGRNMQRIMRMQNGKICMIYIRNRANIPNRCDQHKIARLMLLYACTYFYVICVGFSKRIPWKHQCVNVCTYFIVVLLCYAKKKRSWRTQPRNYSYVVLRTMGSFA